MKSNNFGVHSIVFQVSGKDNPIAVQGSLQLSEYAVMGNDVSVGFGAWLPAVCRPAWQVYQSGQAWL